MRSTASGVRPGIGGFSVLELTVSFALIAVFAGLLLERLLYYQEAAEKAVMELEANKLKLALQVHIGDLIARNRALDYPQIARENPMGWLDRPPVGYRGEFDGDVSADLPRGSWYFDRSSAEVVYLVKLDRNLQVGSGGRARVRWRVKLIRPEGVAAKDGMVMGMQLIAVEPYRWF
jgi:type II secretory pathway pseudopilin PulG